MSDQFSNLEFLLLRDVDFFLNTLLYTEYTLEISAHNTLKNCVSCSLFPTLGSMACFWFFFNSQIELPGSYN